MTRGEHNPHNRAIEACCRNFETAKRREITKDADVEYREAWTGDADDRALYNLGNGGRRVPPRGGQY
jgi:hypothetical protein